MVILVVGLLLTLFSGVYWTANLGGEIFGWRWIGSPRAYALESINIHGWSSGQIQHWMNDLTDDLNKAQWELRPSGLMADWIFWNAVAFAGYIVVRVRKHTLRSMETSK